MTIYDHEGLRIELMDDDAVVIYVEGVRKLEMTLAEWVAANTAMNKALA